MLEIAKFYLALLPRLQRLVDAIAKWDPDLARQLRRSMTSVMLNLAEGYGSTKGTKTARYESAYGSLKETQAGLLTAVTLGYVEELEPTVTNGLDRVGGTLWRLMRR